MIQSYEKTYAVECSGGGEVFDAPELAIFSVDRETATFIVEMSALVKRAGIYKVAKFDARVTWLETDPRDLLEGDADGTDISNLKWGEDDVMRAEADALNVNDDRFWFSCYRKHCDDKITTADQSISDLAAFFGIPFPQEAVQVRATAAVEFWNELMGSVETLTGIADQHGVRTLTDVMYLHQAILSGSVIDDYPENSKLREVIALLPSSIRWMAYIRCEPVGTPEAVPLNR